ncbi:hypothetical protein SDC9_196266 [bioreactor metagenome]|uniref:HTH cro/C1-type domain-containing protein n=1 Tax=bioreactor metagenome TaxID=1076179 RepID=A0A645IBK5_9ZZZZ
MCSEMDFATRLYELRENANLKQIELAQKINLKSSAISKYEKGLTQPNIETLIKLSEIFSVSVDYLIGISDIPNPYTAENYTPKEANIIQKYRKLTKENQIRIDERISAIIDSQR